MATMSQKSMKKVMDEVGQAAVAKNMPWTMTGKGKPSSRMVPRDTNMTPQPKKKKTRLGGEVT